MDVERWEVAAGAAALFVLGFVIGLPCGAAWWRHLTGPGFSSAIERDLQRLSERARRAGGHRDQLSSLAAIPIRPWRAP